MDNWSRIVFLDEWIFEACNSFTIVWIQIQVLSNWRRFMHNFCNFRCKFLPLHHGKLLKETLNHRVSHLITMKTLRNHDLVSLSYIVSGGCEALLWYSSLWQNVFNKCVLTIILCACWIWPVKSCDVTCMNEVLIVSLVYYHELYFFLWYWLHGYMPT
jgi:hypothetical protein